MLVDDVDEVREDESTSTLGWTESEIFTFSVVDDECDGDGVWLDSGTATGTSDVSFIPPDCNSSSCTVSKYDCFKYLVLFFRSIF